MQIRTTLLALCLGGAVAAAAVTPQAPATQTDSVDALLKDLKWRNIGPANMAGRVADIEAVEANPAIVFVGAASGGVWKSTNAGTTWKPVFTDQPTSSIGDIAIFQKDPNIVWVGTGEECVRNSVSWGDGIYKSTDGGETFVSMGLKETHHIGQASSRIRRIPTSSTWRRRDTCGATTASAGSTRRPTVARRGGN